MISGCHTSYYNKLDVLHDRKSGRANGASSYKFIHGWLRWTIKKIGTHYFLYFVILGTTWPLAYLYFNLSFVKELYTYLTYLMNVSYCVTGNPWELVDLLAPMTTFDLFVPY